MAPARSSGDVALELLPGAPSLLRVHARDLPQRDDLCGAFCGSLALAAAGVARDGADQLDQDRVAHAAGTWVSASPDPHALPQGEASRRDYRVELPRIEQAGLSGTTPAGLTAAIERLSHGTLSALPFTAAAAWSEAALNELFGALLSLRRPATLVANVATRELWGSHARVEQMLAHLLEGALDGPQPDWDVGHFVCVFARARGPAGVLYAIADTYPALGNAGVHPQPAARLARALQRPGMAAGGLIAVVAAEDAQALRGAAARARLREGTWDNGTRAPEAGA